MSSKKQGTIITPAKIDVSPDGVTITFEAIDEDISRLISGAGEYDASVPEYHTHDSSDVKLVSKKKIVFVDRTDTI